jgi:ribosomal protein S7
MAQSRVTPQKGRIAPGTQQVASSAVKRVLKTESALRLLLGGARFSGVCVMRFPEELATELFFAADQNTEISQRGCRKVLASVSD